VAQLHARGELVLGEDFVNESFIGTHFVGRAVRETTVGPAGAAVPAVVPTITGRAWVTGTAQYHLDPADPFPEGFEL
jgi:proline racemase